MHESLNPKLVDLLACPDCSGDLAYANNQLICNNCEKEYEIRNGIPCLYPSSIDKEHLKEEEALSRMMKRTPLDTKDQFSGVQWDKSKDEFWGMVNQNANCTNKAFINIGCGFDTHYADLENKGNTFVNFDIVYQMLASLKDEHGAKSCVAGDVNKLPFKKASFDYVISIDVIHHESDNLKYLLGTFAELLKPGGTIFLEDPNAWGLFQAPKSIFMPKPLYRLLRSKYHKLKQSTHRPADYEFPTNVWNVKSILGRLGFTDIVVYPNSAYPCIGPKSYQIYKLISCVEYIKKYYNYHYMLSAVKK